MSNEENLTLSNDEFALALSNPSMLAFMIENKARLDRHARKKVEKYISQLTEITEKHNATQDALSQVDSYNLYKIEQTFAAESFIKTLHGSSPKGTELEAYITVKRKLYLESSATAAASSVRKILDLLDT